MYVCSLFFPKAGGEISMKHYSYFGHGQKDTQNNIEDSYSL